MEPVRRQLDGIALQRRSMWAVILAPIVSCGIVHADEADVLKVDVVCNSSRLCNFDVTVQHADAGWSHYANRWEIVTSDGAVLATRVLAHPHDQEQPFTRSLRDVKIPSNLKTVVVRASDSVHGLGGKEMTVTVPDAK